MPSAQETQCHINLANSLGRLAFSHSQPRFVELVHRRDGPSRRLRSTARVPSMVWRGEHGMSLHVSSESVHESYHVGGDYRALNSPGWNLGSTGGGVKRSWRSHDQGTRLQDWSRLLTTDMGNKILDRQGEAWICAIQIRPEITSPSPASS